MSLLLKSEDLPNLPADETLVVDVETTSFDEKTKALQPFNGHRIAGVGISTLDVKQQWYLPLRHHSGTLPFEGQENFNFEHGVQWLKDVLGTGRDLVNHNIKFDVRFLHQDGIKPRGEIIDTGVLARLVHNRLFGKSPYSLDSQAKLYLGKDTGKLDLALKAYLRSIKSKDYGDVPSKVMAPYCEQDVKLTAQLYEALLTKLPEFSASVWQTEVKLTKYIVRSEIAGLPVDQVRLKTTYRNCLKTMLELNDKINDYAGEEVDPGKDRELTRILIGKFGVVPKAFTPKTGEPQWNQMAFNTIEHPIGKLIGEYRSIAHFMNTYCKGWVNRIGEDGRLHADFWQAGTKTGRLSSHDPNLQNVPPEAEIFVMLPEGFVLVMYDYSQMEYRVFGHYTKSDNILGEYNKNPYMDFHGHLAGMLGVDRQFAKQMNFSFIYGMGRNALINNLAGLIAIKGAEDENMRETMRTYLTGGGQQTKERAKQLNTSETKVLANKIFDDYHRKFPEIRDFGSMVKRVVKRRGWIKNLYGRKYVFEPGSPVHKAINYLCQGSAADCCKERIVGIHEEVMSKYPDAVFLNQIHDSVLFMVPEEQYLDFAVDATKCLEAVPSFLRVPMLVDVKVAHRYWAQATELKSRLELVGETKFKQGLADCLETSKTAVMREWAA